MSTTHAPAALPAAPQPALPSSSVPPPARSPNTEPAASAGRRAGRLETLSTALFLLPVTMAGVAVFSILMTGLGLASLWIGMPIAMGMIYFTRHFTDLHRLWFGRRFGVRVDRPYRERPDVSGPAALRLPKRFAALLADPQTWRDQAWLLVNATVGVTLLSTIVALFAAALGSLTMGLWWGLLPAAAEFHTFGIPGLMVVHDSASAALYGVPAGLVYLGLWWVLTPVLMRVHLQTARALLGTPESLASRVERTARALEW